MKIFIPILILSFSFQISCNKRGCTYPQAQNYEPEAKWDDGGCYFNGSTLIWYSEKDAEHLINDGASSLYFQMDGYSSNSQFHGYPKGLAKAPACDTINSGFPSISRTYLYENNLHNNLHLIVKDQTGFVYGEFDIPVVGDKCLTFQLTNFNSK